SICASSKYFRSAVRSSGSLVPFIDSPPNAWDPCRFWDCSRLGQFSLSSTRCATKFDLGRPLLGLAGPPGDFGDDAAMHDAVSAVHKSVEGRARSWHTISSFRGPSADKECTSNAGWRAAVGQY